MVLSETYAALVQEEGKEKSRYYSYREMFDEITKNGMDAEIVMDFLNQKVSRFIKDYGDIVGSRWRIHESMKLTKSNCLAGFVSDLFCAVFWDMYLWSLGDSDGWCNITAETAPVGYAGLDGVHDRYHTVVIYSGEKEVVLFLDDEPCKIPKKIKTSHTDGRIITNITCKNDCSLRELFGDEIAKKMGIHLLTESYLNALERNKPTEFDYNEGLDRPVRRSVENRIERVKEIEQASRQYQEDLSSFLAIMEKNLSY